MVLLDLSLPKIQCRAEIIKLEMLIRKYQYIKFNNFKPPTT